MTFSLQRVILSVKSQSNKVHVSKELCIDDSFDICNASDVMSISQCRREGSSEQLLYTAERRVI